MIKTVCNVPIWTSKDNELVASDHNSENVLTISNLYTGILDPEEHDYSYNYPNLIIIGIGKETYICDSRSFNVAIYNACEASQVGPVDGGLIESKNTVRFWVQDGILMKPIPNGAAINGSSLTVSNYIWPKDAQGRRCATGYAHDILVKLKIRDREFICDSGDLLKSIDAALKTNTDRHLYDYHSSRVKRDSQDINF